MRPPQSGAAPPVTLTCPRFDGVREGGKEAERAKAQAAIRQFGPGNAKRLCRLMRKHGLLLENDTGLQRPRERAPVWLAGLYPSRAGRVAARLQHGPATQ
jgi:hypothetical protein